MKVISGIVVALLGYFLCTALPDLPKWGDGNAPANRYVSAYYLENSLADGKVPNVVTSVLADYRAFDTMLETGVVFIAFIAIFSLLRKKEEETEVAVEEESSLIIRVAARIMVPMIQLFSLYVVAHGHYSPGGGFQGGVMLGASLILFALANSLKEANSRINESKVIKLSAIGVLIFAGIGAICMAMGAHFLDYSVLKHILPATDGVMARYHAMLAVEVGVALTVMCGMFGIYASLSSDGKMDKGL